MYFDSNTSDTSSAQIKFFAVFHVGIFFDASQLGVPILELGISSSIPYRKSKFPLISLMIVNNGEDKVVFVQIRFKQR